MLDLFAGTGAMGLEALSRGAERALFVDQSSAAVRVIRTNIELCGAGAAARIIHGTAPAAVKALAQRGERFDLVFMDPPYGKGLIDKTIGLLDGITGEDSLVVAEHHVKDVCAPRCGRWIKTGERRYGDALVSFYGREVLPDQATTPGS